MSDEWNWELRGSAQETFEGLDDHQQDRLVSKLDEIVNDEWRTPDEYLDPLTGSPYSKLRIGSFRLACSARQDEQLLRSTASNTGRARIQPTTTDATRWIHTYVTGRSRQGHECICGETT